MKRSEMLEHIQAELEELVKDYHSVSVKRYPYWIKYKAESLLGMIEGFGMLPPLITKMSDTWFRDTGQYGCEVPEWENED